MLRHNWGDLAEKFSALFDTSALPHYNNLGRSIEAQLVYRAMLNWTAAGPAMLPCAQWPALPPRAMASMISSLMSSSSARASSSGSSARAHRPREPRRAWAQQPPPQE